MKAITFFIVIVIFLVGFSGKIEATQVVGFIVTPSGLGDHSFNDMTYTGLIKVKKQLDIILIREKTDETAASKLEAVKKLVERGAELIVLNGWEFRAVTYDAALQYPDTRFLLNDAPLQGMGNVVSIQFAQNEGAYLAGALAGWVTKTAKIGFIGGEDMPVIQDFLTGFNAGLSYSHPDAKLIKKYIAPYGSSPSGFGNPGAAYRVAEELFHSGVDIIFSVAGLSGNGVMAAARKYNRYVIGVDADQDHMAKGLVITSVMKRLDYVTFREVKRALTGDFTPGVRYYDLKKGGVSLSPMTYTRHLISEDILEKLVTIEESIKTGKIKVPDGLSIKLNQRMELQ